MTANEGLLAWLNLLHVRQAVLASIDDALEAEHDISSAWFEVLATLASAPDGRLAMQDLATAIVLSKSGVTRLVDRMAAHELVERVPCAHDRRVTFASLMPAGRARFEEALPTYARAVEDRFASALSRSEMKALRAGMRKVLGANGLAEAACPETAAMRAG